MTKRIEIIEVGPRDGLQNQDAILSTPDKVAMVEKLIEAGARRLEVASFVNPARVGMRGHATWPQLREMADAGMSIQSHGWDHSYFDALSPDALERDLRRSKAEIEQRLGHRVTLLAPPGGRTVPMLAHLAPHGVAFASYNTLPGAWIRRIATHTMLAVISGATNAE